MHYLQRIFLTFTVLGIISLGTTTFAEAPTTNQLLPSENTQQEKTHYNFEVDTQKIQDTWLGRVNRERSIRGLNTLTLDERLNDTAIEWANHLASNRQFNLVHRRPGQTCSNYRCYNPGQRFLERGVNQYAQETVLYGGYYPGADPTNSLIESLRGRIGGPSGFLGLIIGEMSYNGVHYRMMLNPSITKLGVGVEKTTHSGFGSAYMAVIHFE